MRVSTSYTCICQVDLLYQKISKQLYRILQFIGTGMVDMRQLEVEQFCSHPGLLLDVRAPKEYHQGHIPGAENWPLFDDDERAVVGTLYKEKGHLEAFEQALVFIGPKLPGLLRDIRARKSEGPVRVYCARGGLRSRSVASVLEWARWPIALLNGGYKSWRRWTLHAFGVTRRLFLLGGLTGAGKGEVLTALAQSGASTIDLERLACHRGSAYGALPVKQPTCEQFENDLAQALAACPPDLPLWLEDESLTIGSCRLPHLLFAQMQRAPLFLLSTPYQLRLQRIVEVYRSQGKQLLIEATERLHKRFGDARTRNICALISSGDLTAAADLILPYYDQKYTHALSRRQGKTFPLPSITPPELAQFLCERPLEN